MPGKEGEGRVARELIVKVCHSAGLTFPHFCVRCFCVLTTLQGGSGHKMLGQIRGVTELGNGRQLSRTGRHGTGHALGPQKQSSSGSAIAGCSQQEQTQMRATKAVKGLEHRV